MPTLAEQRERFPLRSDWMSGLQPHHHPWAYELHDEYDKTYGYDTFSAYDSTEGVLWAVTAAQPARLDGKRRDFRSVRTGRELGAIEAERTFAARLAVNGVAFDLGAPMTPQPDLVLRDLNLGVEITHRTADPAWELMWHLKQQFASRSSRPQLHIELEFSGSAVRDQVKGARRAGRGDQTCGCGRRTRRLLQGSPCPRWTSCNNGEGDSSPLKLPRRGSRQHSLEPT